MDLYEVEKIDGYKYDESNGEAVVTLIIDGVAYKVSHESEMYCGQVIQLYKVPMPQIVCLESIVIDGQNDTYDGDWGYTSNGKTVFVVTNENCECGGSSIDYFNWKWSN